MDREEGSLEQHIAFSVVGRTFNQIHKRLKDKKIAFGSNPDERENEQINHTFAPRGLYWENVDGCLFEVMTYEY